MLHHIMFNHSVFFLHCGWSLRQHFVLCICQRTKVCYPCMISNNICGIFQSSNGRATDSLSLHNICGHRVCMICDTIPLKDETPITLKFHHTHTYTKKILKMSFEKTCYPVHRVNMIVSIPLLYSILDSLYFKNAYCGEQRHWSVCPVVRLVSSI